MRFINSFKKFHCFPTIFNNNFNNLFVETLRYFFRADDVNNSLLYFCVSIEIIKSRKKKLKTISYKLCVMCHTYIVKEPINVLVFMECFRFVYGKTYVYN